jgi:polyhydroxybutyrate depolymerase
MNRSASRIPHRALSCVATIGLSLTIAAAAHAAPTELTIETADGARHALVVSAGDGPRPTVLVLHGALGTGAMTMRSTGFAEAAARHGFTAVYPDGIGRRWNDGRTDGRGSTVDDVGFIRALAKRLVADRVARPDALYIAGISNGGMMSLAMMCMAPDLFAGVGTIIASLPAGVGPCAYKPMPVVMINGTADPMVPYRGGAVGFRGERGLVRSVDETLSTFAKVDGCREPSAPQPLARRDASATTSVMRIEWQGCAVGTSVVAYRVDGGGHTLPGRPGLLGWALGPTNEDFSGADAILDVFAANR